MFRKPFVISFPTTYFKNNVLNNVIHIVRPEALTSSTPNLGTIEDLNYEKFYMSLKMQKLDLN